MSNSKYFRLNGHKYYTEQEFTVLELINYLNFTTSLLVLEYNNLICEKKNWNKIIIQNNDKIELITIVGGG